MTTSMPPRLDLPRRRIIAAIAILVALLLGDEAARFAVELLWFDEVGQRDILLTRIATQSVCTAAGFAVAFAVLAFAVLRVLRRGPALRLTRGREIRIVPMDQRARPLVLLAVTAVAAMFAGPIGAHWLDFRLALAHVPYGLTEPIFGRDAGDYVFLLPVWRLLGTWGLALSAVAVVATALLEGALAAMGGSRGLPAHALRGIGAWAAFGCLWMALEFVIAQYGVLYSPHGTLFGPGYADVHARLPALRILACGAVALGAAMAWAGWRGSGRTLVLPLAIFVGLWIVLGGIWPTALQRFVVEPNELAKERPYLENAIRLTRAAYDLDAIGSQSFDVERNVGPTLFERNRDLVDNIRLWDWRPLLATYGQIQEIRLYYNFADVDLDRYPVGGVTRQVMLSARELAVDQLPEGAQTWVNLHLKYTHGYGICMSPVNQVTGEGLPQLWLRDIPPVSDVGIGLTRPELYYGEQTSTFTLVGTSTDEFDYPTGDTNQSTRYAGRGGIAVGSLGRRLLLAWALRSREMLFTAYLTPESRILLHRDIRERIFRIAPFLRYDHDPYIVLSDGRLYWVQDAYTTSDQFPASRPVHGINTIRNAVKVVVDAYDGTTRFYAAAPDDPILRTYEGVFPHLCRPLDEMPAGVRAHLRFPEDLFSIQAQALATYHMQDAQVFYNREDLWDLPHENLGGRDAPIDPYYAMMRVDPAGPPEFVLVQPFTPARKANMIAWLVARCDGTHLGERRVVLFPKHELIYGPQQIEARIDQDAAISQLLTLWNQRGSNVVRGSLLVIPVGGFLLYVQPLFLQAEKGALPELKRVIVANAEHVELGEDLHQALARLVGTEVAPDTTVAVRPVTAAPTPSSDPVERALDLLHAAETALEHGDWAAHGRRMQELKQALEAAAKSAQRP